MHDQVDHPQSADRQLAIADVGAFDRENPRSLINLLPDAAREALIRSQNFFLKDWSEETLRRNIQHTPEYKTVRCLRQSLWNEYNKSLSGNRRMVMTRIWEGIVDAGVFYSILKEDHFAAYIFTRPLKQEILERSLLETAYEQIEEILTASHYNKDNSLNAQAARVKFEIWKHLDERVQGGIVKQVATKIEQKSVNVNLSSNDHTKIELHKAEELGKRLAELREQTKDIETVAHVIEYDDDEGPSNRTRR